MMLITIMTGKIIAENNPTFKPSWVILLPGSIAWTKLEFEFMTILDTTPTILGPIAHPISPPKARMPNIVFPP